MINSHPQVVRMYADGAPATSIVQILNFKESFH